MKIFQAGIIGCGKIGSDFADDPKMQGDIFSHAEAYASCQDTQFAAICDNNEQQLTRCGERWEIGARYHTVREMLEHKNLDIVSICTPDDTHYQIVKEILKAPQSIKAILCEKPLASSAVQAQELITLAKQHNIVLAVIYMRRFAQNMRALRSFLSSNQLGSIQAVAGWYTKGVKHNGSHWFDLLRYLAGEVIWVEAWNRLKDSQNDPTLDVVLGLDNGSIATLRACDTNYYTIFEMEILGSLGRVRLIDSGYTIEYSKVMDSKRYTGYKELEVAPYTFGDRKNFMLHAVEDTILSLRTGKKVACSGEDGLAAITIANAAIESAQLGKMTKIN